MTRTITVNGKQLKKENVYLDLSKLSEDQINNINRYKVYSKVKPSDGVFKLEYIDGYWTLVYHWQTELSKKQEITYSQFIELMGGESTQTEQFGISEQMEKAKKLLEENGNAVFPLDENGIPDLRGFDGVEMEVEDEELGEKRNRKVLAKLNITGETQYLTDAGTFWDSVRPIQPDLTPELTPEEIVEKLGKDYLLNLIDNIETFRAENKVLISYSIITQPDWQSVAEKLAEVVEKQNELILKICGIVDFDLETVREYKMAIIACKAESALNEYEKLKN